MEWLEHSGPVAASACHLLPLPQRWQQFFLSICVVLSLSAQAESQQPAETIAPRGLLNAVDLKSAARQSFEHGDFVQAGERLASLLDLYRRSTQGDPYQWLDRLAEVSLEYLRAGELGDALKVLGEAADLNLPFKEGRGIGLVSAAGGLHRRLARMDPGERFELLYEWSMPTETRRTVRVLTSITPTDAPPPVFARALGERARRSAFAVAEIGGLRGLFCSAWELVAAANDAGNLRRLKSELSQLVNEDVPNARFSLMLARIVETRRPDQELAKEIAEFHRPERSHAKMVFAAACLSHEWSQAIGERILKTELEQTDGPESLLMRPFLRYAHATAIRRRHREASPEVLSSDLELWVPSSPRQAWPRLQGSVRSVWLAHQDHILHQTGPRSDYLFFKYPLTGEFEFACDTQIGGTGGSDGCVAYGGLGYEVWAARSLARVWNVNLQKVTEFPCPFVHNHPIPTFNHFTLKSTADGVTFGANGHQTWTDQSKGPTSPWIGLHSWGERVPIFRNLRISGNPIIPREVKMSDGASLRGWVANYYGEKTPQAGPVQVDSQAFFRRMTTGYDWSAAGGVIHGAKRAASTGDVAQSRLYYLRPLQNGESISYEFEYDPGQLEVHPTLGQLAFLIEPSGVRLHWMTSGDQEWTGLAEDNALIEPLNRRGPKPLPLVPGDWNRVTLGLETDTVTLSLNNTQIYTRKIDSENERTFGFYHDKNRSAVRVRHVVMRGDWPEQLTDEQLNNLAAVADAERSDADRRVLGAIFDDQHVHGSVLAVHQHAAQLPADQRYAFLSDWVLPGPAHDTLRLALDFTPTNPAPPLADKGLVLQPAQARATTGGDLVSPALDLVAVAKELSILDELRERVVAIQVTDDGQQRRSQLSMLALVDIAAGDLAKAAQTLDELAASVAASDSVTFAARWPETLAIWGAARFAQTREAVRDMAFRISVNQVRKRRKSGYEAWDQQMRALASRVAYYDLLETAAALPAGPTGRLDGRLPLRNWVPTSRETMRTRGQGFPQAQWTLTAPATIENVASHHEDYLFYRIPMRGNFEVECDVPAFGYRTMTLWVAGKWVGPAYTLRDVTIGNFRRSQKAPLDPPMHKPRKWIRYRAVVRDGVCTTYANGRQIQERALEAEHDPWLAVRSPHTANGAVRNLRVSGNPEIPTEVRLTANAELPGWLPINEGYRVGRNRNWQPLGDFSNGGGIRGRRSRALAGADRETLLRYHRPMVEDGTIEYEFYYRAGQMHVHPALDRLAFMLQPDGVYVHWVTDGKFDRTELAPDNLFDEPQNRRGSETLPLKADTWNRLQLSLSGDIVELKLNDELIYERELELTNQRTFGLFHYEDRTVAQVRNVVWRGDWPRELPAVSDQELAGGGADFLDESLDELTAVFHHDFAQDGLPMERFRLDSGNLADLDAGRDGVRVTRFGGKGYNDSALVPRLTIHGDFDISAAFDHFEPNPTVGGSSGVLLRAFLDSAKSNECLIFRRHLWRRTGTQPVVQGSYSAREVGGTRRSRFAAQVVEARGGRLRLARRGDTVYFLFAENDSPHFRLFGTQIAEKDDIRLLRLLTQTQGNGVTQVVWKSLTIRANRLSGLALQDQAKFVATLNRQRDEYPHRFSHDFDKDAFGPDRFNSWGLFQPSGESGIRMISIGTDRWTSSGFNTRLGVKGGFDVSVMFDRLELARPKEKLSSTINLQVRFSDAAKTQANIVVVQRIDRDRQIYAEIRGDAKGRTYRRMGMTPVEDVEKLRLVRRGKQLSFLYREKDLNHDQTLAQCDFNDLPIRSGRVRMLLHTGGDGRQSQVLLRRLDVRGETITPNPANTFKAPGLLKSLLNPFE